LSYISFPVLTVKSSLLSYISFPVLIVNLIFCSGYNVPILSKFTKEAFSVEGVRHSTNTLPKIVHGQAFRMYNLTTPPPPRGIPLSAIRGCTEQLCGSEP
jgi:hypothetical protein